MIGLSSIEVDTFHNQNAAAYCLCTQKNVAFDLKIKLNVCIQSMVIINN